MEFLYRLIFRRRLRRWLRRPRNLLVALCLASGWLRGFIVNQDSWIWLKAHGIATAHTFLPPNVAGGVERLSVVGEFGFTVAFALCATWFVGRLVVDLPGYTKALFWGVTRSYEHNISRLETIVLIGLPAVMLQSIVSTGLPSLAALLLTGIALAFHSSAYNFRRLRTRTDDVMRSRAELGWAEPPGIETE